MATVTGFKIEIEREEEYVREVITEWVVLEKVGDIEKRGYAPPQSEIRTRCVKVLEQHVQTLDLEAVICAINNIQRQQPAAPGAVLSEPEFDAACRWLRSNWSKVQPDDDSSAVVTVLSKLIQRECSFRGMSDWVVG